MKDLNALHVGSDFQSVLIDDGTLNQATAIAVKRVLSWQIQQAMQVQNINKSHMAKLMRTSRSSLDRLLNADDTSLTLSTLAGAAQALGKRLVIQLV